jgi:hypothetical protein
LGLISISETPRHLEASIHKTSPPPPQNLLRLYYQPAPLALAVLPAQLHVVGLERLRFAAASPRPSLGFDLISRVLEKQQ